MDNCEWLGWAVFGLSALALVIIAAVMACEDYRDILRRRR